MKSIELVSPAGSPEKLRFAFAYGADAVYLGAKSFSLREGAANFSLAELNEGVAYAHSEGRKAYLAANIFFHDSHFGDFSDFLTEIKNIPVDGIIISDIGAVSYVREKYPDLPVHISTQANTVNSESAMFYQKLGVKRIILARELSIGEIKSIRDRVSVELESFVHGAMCISYSGRCLLSNYLTNKSLYRPGERPLAMKKVKTRDANLGDCSQSCRWEYYLVESTRKNSFLPVEESENGTAILSSRDLNLSAQLGRLMEAGIDAFKIEGRMKSLYYVAGVTRVYRHCIDAFASGARPDPQMLEELEKVSHREYTTGFYFNENLAPVSQELAPTKTSGYIREYTFLGHVIEKKGPKSALVRAMNRIMNGSRIEAIGAGRKAAGAGAMIGNFTMEKESVPVEKVQAGDEFVLSWDGDAALGKYDIIRSRDE